MKKIIALCTLAFLGAKSQAQVKDLTLTIQPTASYNWFDKNSAIEDGIMYGARVGFGFGESIELRAIYERSTDLKNTVNDFNGFSDDFIENFNSRTVDISRIGGEFKANIPTRGTFVPYLTIGAGVQTLKVDVAAVGAQSNELESEQIYGAVGLGTQIKLGRRLFLNLEAKNTIFNLNPASVLFQEGQDQSEFEDFLNDNDNSRLYNWSVFAGLQLYLGGRTPEESSALDRAYRDKFSGGLNGFKLIFEPVGAFINFDNSTNLADTYLLGGKVGLDLNQYVGIRGYYMRATRNKQVSTDFDDLAIYGGDFIAKLNVSRGLVPYINVGGGYLNVNSNSYIGNNDLIRANSGYFAKGGLGLNVPLGRNVEIFGDASLMYTSQRDEEDLQNTISPDELRQHVMYTAGVRFQLGKKAEDTDRILQNEIDQRVAEDTKIYQNRIDQLEEELSKAYKNNDTKKAVDIIEEKKELERRMYIKSKSTSIETKKETLESRVIMTPKELEEMIEKVIQGVDEESNKKQGIDDRMNRLERLLLEVNTGEYRQNLSPARQEDASQRILDKLNELDRKIDRNSVRIDNPKANTQSQDKTTVISLGQPITATVVPVATETLLPAQTKVTTDADGNTTVTKENANQTIATGLIINEGLSVFTGIAVADNVAMTIGIRGNYSFTNSPFKFMPDLYLAPGKNTGFGVNANVVLPFKFNSGIILDPYVGVGVGYNDAAGQSTFSPNLILGTSFNLLGGKLFADYTAHNFVDIHRLSLGYKFNF